SDVCSSDLDGVDVLRGGAHALVDDDLATLAQLDADLVQAEALGARCEADGDHDAVCLEGLGLLAVGGLDVHLDALALAQVTNLGGLVPGLEVDRKSTRLNSSHV